MNLWERPPGSESYSLDISQELFWKYINSFRPVGYRFKSDFSINNTLLQGLAKCNPWSIFGLSPVSAIKFYWDTAILITYVLSAFILKWQSWVAVVETDGLPSLKLYVLSESSDPRSMCHCSYLKELMHRKIQLDSENNLHPRVPQQINVRCPIPRRCFTFGQGNHLYLFSTNACKRY